MMQTALKNVCLMSKTCGIKFQFSKFLYLFNFSSAVVTAAVTSVRSNKEQVEIGTMYIDYMLK